jgi:hypothetical protein
MTERTVRVTTLAESNAVSDDEFAAMMGTADLALAHAQACLDLFEKDWGRRATTAFDLRNWADVQDPESLRSRILRRVRADQVWAKACRSIWHDVPAPLASRPPIGQRICLTLAQAAKTTGLSVTAILDAIADGRIAATRDMQDDWHVERAELARAFPTAPAGAARSQSGNGEPLDAAALLLEIGISTLVRQAGDALRRRRA